MAPARTRRWTLTRLEDRTVLAGNLNLTSVSLVDGANAALATPVVGQQLAVKAAWSSAGVATTNSYAVRVSLDGTPYDVYTITPTSTATLNYAPTIKAFYAKPGTHTLTVTLDPANAVGETSETDNTRSITFTAATPTPPLMRFPLEGTAGTDWTVLRYADLDPRIGVRADYRGGGFQFDNRDGLDAGPVSFTRMDRGVGVFAAADGTVTAVTDGNFDRETAFAGTTANGVVVDHGNGWTTTYSRLANGSIPVKVGDVVKAGQLLGLVGASGDANAPNLHFLVQYKGLSVEPNLAPASYFASPPAYVTDAPVKLLDSGVSSYQPTADKPEWIDRMGTFASFDQRGAINWFTFNRLKTGDVIEGRFYKPDGSFYSSATATQTFDGTLVQWPFTLAATAWSATPGTWQAAAVVNGAELGRTSFTVNGTGVASVRATLGGNVLADGRTTPVDFGTVAKGGTGPTQSVVVQNTGAIPLTLGGLSTPPGISLVGTLPASVAIGGSTTLTFRLDSAAAGTKFGDIRIATNDPDTPVFDFAVAGSVTTTVAAPNAPVIGLPDAALAEYAGSGPRRVAPTATFADADTANFAGCTLKVEMATGGDGFDQLGVVAGGAIAVSGATVSYNGTAIGTKAGGANGAALTVALNGGATPAAVQALLRAVTHSTSEATATKRRSVRFSVSDPSGNASNLAVAHVIPAGATRAPVIVTPAAQTTTRGHTAMFAGSFNDMAGATWTGTASFGDGTTAALTFAANQTYSVSHAYAAAGAKTATVSVTNDLGQTATTTFGVTVNAANAVSGPVVVNGGAIQRSQVTTLAVTFTQPVLTAQAGAFALQRAGGAAPAIAVAWNAAKTQATLTFGSALTDGHYTLTLDSGKLLDANGAALDGNGDGLAGAAGLTTAATFHRMLGDADGDGAVDGNDLAALAGGFNKTLGEAGYVAYLDFDGDSAIDGNDLAAFAQRFNTVL